MAARLARWTALTAILAVYAWLALGYARAIPPWNNADEPAHFLYVEYIALTGKLPVLAPGDWRADLVDRLIKEHFPPEESIDALHYESWQPPLYYLVSVPAYHLAPAGDRLAEMRALREFNVLLGGLTVVIGAFIGRTLFLRQPPVVAIPAARIAGEVLALCVPLTLVGIPMFTSQSGALNNDNLAGTLGALLTLLSVRLALDVPGWRMPALFGLVGGLGILTKLTLAAFVPIGILALTAGAIRAGNPRKALLGGALLAVAALLVVSPWIVRQGLTYGWDDLLAKRHHDAILVGRAFPTLAPEYLQSWSNRVFQSAWAYFGWMQYPAPRDLYAWWSAACQVALVGALAALTRRWVPWRGWRHLDTRLELLVLALLGTFAALLYYNVTSDVQAQGRFLVPALAATVGLFVIGWAALLPTRFRPLGPAIVGLALVGTNAFVLLSLLPALLAG